MPKVKTRKSLHYVSNVSNRKFAVSAEKVENVVVGSALNEESNSNEKSLPEIPHTKKERAKERHNKWIEKFDPTKKSTRKSKKKKKSRQMDICEEQTTLNISELKEFLPDINKEFGSINQNTLKKSNSHIGLNMKPVKSKSTRKNIAKSEIQRFHQVLQHSAFKADPLSTIKQHVENTIEKKQVIDDKSMKTD
ncbi:18956_t:CDS:2 [Funneliformis geosporum]|uniref:Ribosome biogenesis protein SLX9 n=1 Tax=Funneliformis geosporum TaxID=1117311 RepID=A0A9W4SDK8_9GLOM|nr:18956_t:CDS:2 [Funneliformis geosporum]CAI2165068.1 9741_t:CDS:2 [Funneliformis geosporum]